MLLPLPGRASVCEDPGTHSYVSAALVDHDTSELDPAPGTTGQLDQSLQLLVQASDNLAFGYDHRYTKFDFADVDPQTNAHLHSAAFPLHWRRGDGSKYFRAAIAPTLSTSSNVLGHPQQYSPEILQVAFALLWRRPVSRTSGLRYGLCGDDRLGRYGILPVAVLEWQPHPDWEVSLGFPFSGVTWDIRDFVSTGLTVAPDGSEWHVMNRSFDAESRFVHEAYVVEWMVALDAGEHLSIAAGFGRQIRNRFEMTLRSGERVEVEGDDVNRVRLELRWRF